MISKNNMFVALASIKNGLFILNLDDSPVCNISATRPRLNDLNPTYMPEEDINTSLLLLMT